MLRDLASTADEIVDFATANRMVLFGARTGSIGLPAGFVTWDGGWREYLALGLELGVRVLYLERETLDMDEEASQAMREAGFANVRDGEEPVDWTEREWLLDRFREGTREWEHAFGSVCRVTLRWFHESVCHEWELDAEWYSDFRGAITRIAEDSREVERGNRRAARADTEKRALDLAEQLATHPRWMEAKSKEKRAFMAESVFPDLEAQSARYVADLAALYYWWNIEPTAKPGRAERIWYLYETGMSAQAIAESESIPLGGVLRVLAGRRD